MTWLTGWAYRKSHVINAATGAGTNYQVKFVVNYGAGSDSAGVVYCNSLCKTDFGDIRFTTDDGSTVLDCWLESKTDSSNAVFWVEVAGDLSTVNKTVYIYYGKSDATTTSNGANTFLFFDDFDRPDSTNLGANWTEYGDTGWQISENTLYRPNSTSGSEVYALATALGQVTNVAVRCKFNLTVWSGNTYPQMGIISHSNTGLSNDHFGFSLFWGYDAYTTLNTLAHNFGFGTSSTKAGHSLNEWWRFELGVSGAVQKGKAWEIGVDTEPTSYSQSQTWTAIASGYVGVETYRGGTNNLVGYFDDFCVRKWLVTEPTHSTWGTLESDLYITGVTRNSSGVVLGSCTVYLYKTSTKAYVAETTSDAVTGTYSFNVTTPDTYFVVCFKAGSPNVQGCTDKTLVGAAP